MKYIIALSVFLAVIPAGFVHAHKVIIVAWVEEGMIYSESRLGSKREAKNCRITVVNDKGEIVLAGKTDDQGKYAFKIPENVASDLVLHLEAGNGHKAFWRIPEKDLKKDISNKDISNKDIENAVETKAELEQNPSVFKIAAGVGIILFLALVLKFYKKRGIKSSD